MLTALARGKPDRMPATVHQWQDYHLNTYVGGVSALEAFRRFGLDASIQHFEPGGQFWLADPAAYARLSTPDWRDEVEESGKGQEQRILRHRITTPRGTLTYAIESNRKTTWVIDHLIKRDEGIELIRDFMPWPRLDKRAVSKLHEEIGDDGILRGFIWGDQAGCWQHACCLMDVTELILRTFDQPDWVHELLGILLQKKLASIEDMAGARFDLVETGGGAASSTVISPDLHAEFCLPYDRKLHDALHAVGFRVTYHTCGGTVGIEEHIVANGCDASETLAPVSIGGNQEPWEFAANVDGRLALIGGIDQFNVAAEGTPDVIREKVEEFFLRVAPAGGVICSLSDHFFDVPVVNLEAYAAAARDCVY